MANDSSFGSAAAAFDFDTQNGVMHLLASVRASALSGAEKNELRDLIFLYSNGGRDQTVRNNLEQKLNQFGVAALPKQNNYEPPKLHEFGASRPAPAFKAAKVEVSQAAAEVPKSEVSPAPAQETKPAPAAKPAMAEVPDVPPNLPQEAPVAESAPIVDTPAAPITTEPVPVAEASVTPTLPEESLQRIKEIKALVNQQVGNPVNLIDIDNAVGREYMSALLDAMKKINSGSSAASAMQRLETAYEGVEEALKHHADEKANSPEPAQAPAPTEISEPAVEAESAPVRPPLPKFSPLSEEAATPDPAAASAAEDEKQSETPLVRLAQTEQPAAVSEPSEVPAPTKQSSAPQAEPAPSSTATWGESSDKGEAAPAVAQVPIPDSAPLHRATSLAQSETKLRSPDELPDASALETSSVAGDPLYTQQVDDGLNQLLSDWQLFKKSGLFGTGPKGMTHPLYIKIKDLQVPLLLAGRFEGATQEVKQSITDYMNGWRYEQGIVYEQGEIFDHYLRRVIRHILDLHKKR